MRHIPEALQAKLDSGVTTLCRCWIVTRRDHVVQGFTDHDADVVLDDVICHAQTGFAGSEAVSRLGLAVDGGEVAGALSDEALSDAALSLGLYDAAQVDLYIADWSEPSLHVLLSRGHIGEVRREGHAFTAELRGLADALAQETGRLYTAGCNADLGDARCGVDLTAAAYRGTGHVSGVVSASTIRASGLSAFDDGRFTQGLVTFTSGALAGFACEVKRHEAGDDMATLLLWQSLPGPLAIDDSLVVTAGCDKRFATCRDRFANAVNFRGFPHMPGNDAVLRYAIDGEPGHDGRSLR